MIAATKSNPEWAASDKIPRLPVQTPTAIFNPVTQNAPAMDESATVDFSVSCLDEYSMRTKIKKAPRHGGTPVHVRM